MVHILTILTALFVSGCTSLIATTAASTVVVVQPNAPFAQQLAAREVRRYVYLRTGELLLMATNVPDGGDVIRIGVDKALGAQTHRLRSVTKGGRTILHITGGSDVAALYGAYRYAETLGVRFYVHGDVIPDGRVSFALPQIDETHEPLFEHRGILPFHDFTEGPDWWSIDDYKTYISQLAKMRMNWIGFHCYPEGGVGPEPLVWIGLPEDVNDDGTVKFSYPARWASTNGGTFGYAPTKTSEFAAGAGLLFAEDDFGPSVIEGYRPRPRTVEGSNDVFNRTGKFLNEALTHARSLGIKTVIGTETPLKIPKELKAHLQAQGMDPNDPATVQKLYEGMFKRISKAHPLDYYWLWTPEGWTWSGTKQAEVDAAIRDIKTALSALESRGQPFGFATSGWVLGPAQDRSLFDKILPKDAAIACINREVGFAPIEPGFAGVEGRPKWAIPWVEDDPAMVIPQLWAGRMRRDAADAHAYGCTGLLGIHWRTKILAPNFSALAKAGWDQTGWNKDFGQKDYAADLPAKGDAHVGFPNKPRDLPIEDFYMDWCGAHFGPEAAKSLTALFTKLDGGGPSTVGNSAQGANLPRPATWIAGPGGIVVQGNSWKQEKSRYAFVDEMTKLRDQVQGAGNLARFDYWLNTMRYLRAVGHVGCVRGELDHAMKQVHTQKDPAMKKQAAEQALAVRIKLARQWEMMMTLQLAATDTPGEMGTIANLEQHVLRNDMDGGKHRFMDIHDAALAEVLGRPLPDEVRPTRRYLGEPRLIVPTVRTSISEGEALTLKVILLDNERPATAAIFWRPMGEGDWRKIDLAHVARAVSTGTLPPAQGSAIEYYCHVTTATDRPLLWPATAPELNHTLVVVPDPTLNDENQAPIENP